MMGFIDLRLVPLGTTIDLVSALLGSSSLLPHLGSDRFFSSILSIPLQRADHANHQTEIVPMEIDNDISANEFYLFYVF